MRAKFTLSSYLAVVPLIASASSALATDPLKYDSVHIRIAEQGGVIAKSVKELTSKEAQVAVVAACTAFGGECSSAAAAMAVVHQSTQKGEEHRGVNNLSKRLRSL
jgi:hypothetical protein